MSIDRETFERADEAELEELSATDRVLGFLAANDDRAFKAREISRQTELDTGATSTALTRLKARGLVEHKGSYWAVTADEERLEAHVGYARATALFNDEFGEETRKAWREHAPDDPHPSLAGDET